MSKGKAGPTYLLSSLLNIEKKIYMLVLYYLMIALLLLSSYQLAGWRPVLGLMWPRDNHEVEHVGGVAELPGGQGRPPALQYQLLDRLATHERLVEGQQLVEEHPEAEAVHFLCVLLQKQKSKK